MPASVGRRKPARPVRRVARLVTDAQVHIWEPDRPDRPWPPEVLTKPHRPNGFSAEEMIAELDAAGVDRAIIVPPSWIGEINDTALEAAARYPTRFAVMGRFNHQTPGARERLEGWLSQPHLLGIRLTFQHPVWAKWLDDGSLDWFWAAAERLGIPLMLLVPALTAKVHPVAERHPSLRIVPEGPVPIDHLARRSNLRDDAAFADLDDLLSLARYPNVRVKVTSAPSYSTQEYPYANIHPYLRRIYDAFGPRRLLWGSDITRLHGTYRQCLDLFREALDFLSADDREWILGKALAETLNWPE